MEQGIKTQYYRLLIFLFVVLYPLAGWAGRWELGYEEKQQAFRHSFWAKYYVIDTEKKNEKIYLAGGEVVRDAKMSPNGRYIVYGKKDGNLYIYKLDFKTEVAITRDGIDALYGDTIGSTVVNGMGDWLYEEEFGITAMHWFSPDSKQVAFVRLDDKNVPEHKVGNEMLRYPMAGEPNPIATACVYDIQKKQIKTMQIALPEGGYMPRMVWRSVADSKSKTESADLIVQTLNRDQNEMKVYACDPQTTIAAPIYTETQKRYYVDYEQFDEWQWLSDGRFLVVSEKSGWRQVHLFGKNGQEIRQLTADGMDVTKVYSYDEKTGMLYYQAAPTPEVRQVYALNTKKNIARVATADEVTKVGGEVWTDDFEPDSVIHKEFFTFEYNGYTLHAWVLKPGLTPDPSPKGEGRKYPVVLTQYSGPGSQRVVKRWRGKRFEYELVEKGYVVMCVDPRGTAARGRDWRAETYMELGRKEAEDQIALAHYAASLPYIDAGNISMIGWSYGGFQVIRTLEEQGRRQKTMNEAALIKRGVAIAPVTDWRLYDSAYTERYMRRPQVNEGGYDASDLSTMVRDMKGDLLIMHGLADDNVHVEHTLKLTEALIEAGVHFEEMLYPNDNHFLKKGRHYEDVHRRILRFLEPGTRNQE